MKATLKELLLKLTNTKQNKEWVQIASSTGASSVAYVPSSSGMPVDVVLSAVNETVGALYPLTVIGSSVIVLACPLESVTVIVGVKVPTVSNRIESVPSPDIESVAVPIWSVTSEIDPP